MKHNRYKLTISDGIITGIEMLRIDEPISDDALPNYSEIEACLFIPRNVVGFSNDSSFLESLISFDPISIEVEEGNNVFESKLNCLIRKADKTMVLGCRNSYIPEDGSVENIASCALCAPITLNEINLNCFEIPYGVKTIGYRAFANSFEEDIHIIVPDSVKQIEAMAFMMTPGENSECVITFYGSPELEAGVFGTKEEAADSNHETYKNLPDILFVNPEKLIVRGLKNSSVEVYCKKYGIKFEIINNYYEKVVSEIFGLRRVHIDYNDDFYRKFDEVVNCLNPIEKQLINDIYLKGNLHRALRKMRNPKRSKELMCFIKKDET